MCITITQYTWEQSLPVFPWGWARLTARRRPHCSGSASGETSARGPLPGVVWTAPSGSAPTYASSHPPSSSFLHNHRHFYYYCNFYCCIYYCCSCRRRCCYCYYHYYHHYHHYHYHCYKFYYYYRFCYSGHDVIRQSKVPKTNCKEVLMLTFSLRDDIANIWSSSCDNWNYTDNLTSSRL